MLFEISNENVNKQIKSIVILINIITYFYVKYNNIYICDNESKYNIILFNFHFFN